MGFFNLDLHPQWSYSVSYDANGASAGTVPVDSTVYNYRDIAIVEGNSGNLIKYGYNFLGWNTSPDGIGTKYIKDDGFLIINDTVLYAQWRSAYGRGYVSKFSVVAESISGTDKDKPYEIKTWRQPTIIG